MQDTMTRLLTLALAVMLTGTAQTLQAQESDDAHLQDLAQQIAETTEILNGITSDVERVQWQDRLSLLQLDYETQEQKQTLAKREQTLTRSLSRSNEQLLRQQLRVINTKLETIEQDISSLEAELKNAREARAQLADDQRTLQSKTERSEKEERTLADLEVKGRNKEESVIALILRRDATRMKLELGEHALRIEKMLVDRPVSMKPTVHNIMKERRYIESENKRLADLGVRLEELQATFESHSSALALTEAKRKHIDREIELSQAKSTGLRRLGIKLGSLVQAEKRLLADRIEHQRAQIAALGENMQYLNQTLSLLEDEIRFVSEENEQMLRRSWQRVVIPAGIVIGIFLFSFIGSRILLPIFFKQNRLFVARRLGGYLVFLLTLIIIALFFLEDLQAIAVFMGIAGAALVIALQDLVSSFVGWFVIISSRKVGVGDRVEIDEHRGDVIDVQLLRTTLIELNNWLGVDEPTGRIIIVPNSFIFKSKVLNYAHVHPCLWGQIDITVTFETPAKKAYDALLQIVTEECREEFEEARSAAGMMERRYGVPDTVYQPKVYTIIADSGVLYRLLFVANYRRFSSTRTRINNKIVDVFDQDPDLEFAYPTQRLIPTPEGDAFPITQMGAPAPGAGQ